MNRVEKLRRSAMSIASNALSFLKLRRCGMFIRRFMEASFCSHMPGTMNHFNSVKQPPQFEHFTPFSRHVGGLMSLL